MARTILTHIIIIVIVIAGAIACQKARPPVSAENLYSLMNHQDMIEFSEFPEAFKSIEGRHEGIIFANERDTLQLVCSYPNLADEVNRYPFYVIRDNHENYWSLFQEETGKYRIYRESAVEVTPPKWESFCRGGVAVVWMLLIIVIMHNTSATTEKERLSINGFLKLAIFAFLFGGCLGLILI